MELEGVFLEGIVAANERIDAAIAHLSDSIREGMLSGRKEFSVYIPEGVFHFHGEDFADFVSYAKERFDERIFYLSGGRLRVFGIFYYGENPRCEEEKYKFKGKEYLSREFKTTEIRFEWVFE